ncbi:putative protein serine/threonine kinase [Tieghemostelium lacteum]|uniref:Uncharacterized protein n=1 Tax=Tieghemostelium lacteum TaxID=361077 RepID=A0A151ZFK8_TIELA|nr:putative protein serine/threonine kinase [Tieghemostelium lacteum]|eukprot:KYQ92753.1 putative protein serine/threonine kinase [Tieghemostelium lacteum]
MTKATYQFGTKMITIKSLLKTSSTILTYKSINHYNNAFTTIGNIGIRSFCNTIHNNANQSNIDNINSILSPPQSNDKKIKVKIKIKSKDPFIMLPNNKKVYLEGPVSKRNLISEPTLLSTNISNNPNNYIYNNNNNNNNSNDIISQPIESPPISNTNIDYQQQEQQQTTTVYNIKSKKQIKLKQIEIENLEKIGEDISKREKKEEDAIKHTVIIDGTLIAYKSYLSTVNTSIGQSGVNALFGFTRSLIKIIKEMKPDNLVVCFDHSKKSTFRNQIYPEYKNNRSPTPPELLEQFPLIPMLTESMGIAFASQEGYECDDLIATYCRESSNDGNRVTVVSDDKDLLQLVNDNRNISVYSLRENKIYQEGDVSHKYGIPPSLFVTYQSLVGDKIDNIPGVPGIGPKAATALVQSFGNLQNIFDHSHEIKNQKHANLLTSLRDQAQLSYQLAKLNDNVPLQIPTNEIQFNPIDKSKFKEFLQKYQFKSIIETLDKSKLIFKKEQIKIQLKSLDNNNNSNNNINNNNYNNNGLSSTIEEVQEDTTTTTATGVKRKPTVIVEFLKTIEECNGIFPIEDIPISDEEFMEFVPDGVTVVRDIIKAREVVDRLRLEKNEFHACDTEVVDIDLKTESPIGHGRVICFSIYVGEHLNFGNGPIVWVDCMNDREGSEILKIFKEYFEDESIQKVWHNYAFDRHVLANHDINVKGFGGDTLQMARLWDAARANRGGYSLESLSKELLNDHKISIKDLFGSKKIKADGEEGKGTVVPPLEYLQRSRKFLKQWIDYSSMDAKVTWKLREDLHLKLKDMEWTSPTSSMWDFYYLYYRPFGHLLTEMEKRGMKIDIPYLQTLQERAQIDIEENRKKFYDWVCNVNPDCKNINIDSDSQIQQLLFAPCVNSKNKEEMSLEKDFECLNTEGYIEPGAKKAKKKRSFIIRGMGLPYSSVTANGWPSVDSASLRELAGSNPESGKFGTAFEFLMKKEDITDLVEREKQAKEACMAISSLLEVGSIGTLINTFIIPLQNLADKNSRLHTSINVNTETGRLSSRRPNLQNQPALEKDRYKIRKAFHCEPGNTLVVADYGQLELRLLAHITNCKSMIEAFKIGGDFHSRTAMGMYPHVKAAVDKGEVLLEYDGDGEPPKPLLKNVFASERRKAKTLNFSIAYGKTAMGLSKDWGVSLKEAKETLNRWFEDRPEVLMWQKNTIETAHRHKWTRTLMGRYRPLPDIENNLKGMKNHAERASINTPLQGGAADIAMKAMLLIEDNQRLKELGYQLIMQIHDELILEGPEEHAEEAKKLVMSLMSTPFSTPLLIDLVVDCRYAKTWYEAK